MKRIIKNPYSILSIFIIVVIISLNIRNAQHWKKDNRVIASDVIHYYSYLPAIFIYKDLSLSFVTHNPSKFNNKFYPIRLENGNYTIKTTFGLAILYSPWFFIGHLIAKIENISTDGFSPPYKLLLLISSVFYLFLGLIFLRKILLLYFNDIVASITIICIVLGTNLLHYSTSEAAMPHAYSFSLISIFTYTLMKWLEVPRLGNSIALGLLFGLITLIRPVNIIFGVLFLFISTDTIKSTGSRFLYLFRNYKWIIIILLCFFIVWLPQFLYWKHFTGKYFFYSYGNERFYFNHPHILKGFFSYRKGWFVYTPMMLIAITGLPVLYRLVRDQFNATIITLTIYIYVIFSWWTWWYGGSFGCRAIIDIYPLLALPFAAFITWMLQKKPLAKFGLSLLVLLCFLYNIFKTTQYQYGAIHWDAMTKEAFWETFFKKKPTEIFYEKLETPDYNDALYDKQKD